MAKLFRRRHYFIHPSSQVKYIEMAVVPALVLSFICSFFLIASGDIFLMKAKAHLFNEMASLNEVLHRLNAAENARDTAATMALLEKRITVLQDNLELEYFATAQQWAKTKMLLFMLLAGGILFSGFMALLFSHRIAGPICRLRAVAEMFAQGKDTPPIRFRTRDEFKEIADIFEKLRLSLKEKGVLKAAGTE